MPSLWARVEDGVIVEPPGPLPASWGRVSNLAALPTRELVALGWWPVEQAATEGPELEVDVDRRRVITRTT